jgi:hypothetical protein
MGLKIGHFFATTFSPFCSLFSDVVTLFCCKLACCVRTIRNFGERKVSCRRDARGEIHAASEAIVVSIRETAQGGFVFFGSPWQFFRF